MIRVHRVINLVKSYRCSKSVLAIAVLHSCDDIIHTCTGMCNLNFCNKVIITFCAFLQEAKSYYLKTPQQGSDIS